VLLLDDHPAVLRQVAELLPARFEVVASLRDAAALPNAMERHQPDLVVLDITLPGVSGIELASRLRSAGRPPKVVFLTVHDDADYARAGLAAGGSGYVVKARLATDLVPALEAALEGRRFVSPGAAAEGLRGEERNGTDSAAANHSPTTRK
jgi:DNA-binding NarL/FixJ family response regulator